MEGLIACLLVPLGPVRQYMMAPMHSSWHGPLCPRIGMTCLLSLFIQPVPSDSQACQTTQLV